MTKYKDYSVFLFMLPWPYVDYFEKCVCSPASLCLRDTFSHIMCWWRTWEFWVQIPAVSLTSYTTSAILLTVHWPQVFYPEMRMIVVFVVKFQQRGRLRGLVLCFTLSVSSHRHDFQPWWSTLCAFYRHATQSANCPFTAFWESSL